MKLEIKRFVEGRWQAVPIENLLNIPIIDFVRMATVPIAAVIKDKDDQIILMTSNEQKYVDLMEEKSKLALHCDDLYVLFKDAPPLALVANISAGATFVEIKRLKKED